ncbi:MAG TPA: citrate synthase, partial [Lentisphaerae bacterium]|nr:citrate synthase [Lentisphaerota bacterium]
MEEGASEKAVLRLRGRQWELPVLQSTAGEPALDIRQLRRLAGVVCYDPGFANTASCSSQITYIDGENGRLFYRGYPIEELVEKCDFVEVAYLLVHGKLPNPQERAAYADLLNRHSLIHEDMQHFFRNYPESAHPMAILSAMVVSLSTFYPELEASEDEEVDITVTRLLSKVRTIAAYSYKKSVGEPFVYPSHKLKYCENFLNMMFSSSVVDYRLDPVVVRTLDRILILHADHGQNCSTTTVRMVGSAGANLYASVAAGICALWGDLHGGANQAVIAMLQRIADDGGNVDRAVEMAKSGNRAFRLMGFGHRVYKAYDPRARIAKRLYHELVEHLGLDDPLHEIALRLEERALKDPYFTERGLYPNIDFYTGLIFRAMGIPEDMFTVMFALGRLPGWIAHW